jgi:amino-acid N-acetyltransferase
MTADLTFRPATVADWPAVEALLLAAGLPLDGAREHIDNYLVGYAGGQLAAVAGLELYGRVALLRSVAVAGPLRGRGIGERLVEAVKARARQLELGSLYLLTTTAAPFFSQQGFSLTARSAMPSALQASRELQGVCPASATAMGVHLGA